MSKIALLFTQLNKCYVLLRLELLPQCLKNKLQSPSQTYIYIYKWIPTHKYANIDRPARTYNTMRTLDGVQRTYQWLWSIGRRLVCICFCVCIYIYIYIWERERERERETVRESQVTPCYQNDDDVLSIYLSIYLNSSVFLGPRTSREYFLLWYMSPNKM